MVLKSSLINTANVSYLNIILITIDAIDILFVLCEEKMSGITTPFHPQRINEPLNLTINKLLPFDKFWFLNQILFLRFQQSHVIFIVMLYDALCRECRRHLSALCHANQLPTSLQICINRQVGYFYLYTLGINLNTQHVFV